MKLLIVDDEELTRTGVISSIDWKSLGIDEVLQADDGLNGLETARIHKPEIILCDVRMPRMDGISMLERLEGILPDAVPIFMSGYSDKEYLKAAIKLKAVSYIEKPLDPQEIRAAVSEARETYLQKLRSHRGETLHSMETASRLALLLATPYESSKSCIRKLTEELSLDIQPSTFFTAVMVKVDGEADPSAPSMDELYQKITDYLQHYHLECLFAEKRVQYLIYFVFGAAMPSGHIREDIRAFFCRLFSVFGRYYVTAGETVTGISRAYHSYTSAVILLQSSFFFPNGTFLSSEGLSKSQSAPREPLPQEPEKLFDECLSSRDKDGCRQLLDCLERFYDRNPSLLPNEARDLYYKLFRSLSDASRQLRISASAEPENIVDVMESAFSFRELHESLLRRTEKFFADAETVVRENPTIFLIKDYISKNYMDETLSVKDISSHVFLSATYVCTFFKSETGQTLNQYLTEYRMEKAKQLLGDMRYKITDISSRVGYSDGSYFGKSFKKHTGLSPSEYREKASQKGGAS